MLTSSDVRAGMGTAAIHLVEVADELSAADRILGDGDLGVTFVRGCGELVPALADLPDDLGKALACCAVAFTKSGGSSFGTLVSTGLLAAAKLWVGRTEVPWAELPDALRAGADAMLQRGKANVGDKTVIDGILAVADAVTGKVDPVSIRAAALQACDDVLDEFRNRPCRIGRARIGDRSIGVDDPGMLAWREMVRGTVGAD